MRCESLKGLLQSFVCFPNESQADGLWISLGNGSRYRSDFLSSGTVVKDDSQMTPWYFIRKMVAASFAAFLPIRQSIDHTEAQELHSQTTWSVAMTLALHSP
jgi:hypothetical protein